MREAPPPPAPPAPAATEAERPPTAVTIGRVTFWGGTVSFSDRFVKPNYSAVLTDLAGSVSGLSSQADTTADVAVDGRLDQSAPVAITRKVNPLSGNLLLDLKAAVKDVELGTFTPYSGKYLGYDIKKGKLNFDVSYRVENCTLNASNRLVLDQLTFGPKVESATATSLPPEFSPEAPSGCCRRSRRAS